MPIWISEDTNSIGPTHAEKQDRSPGNLRVVESNPSTSVCPHRRNHVVDSLEQPSRSWTAASTLDAKVMPQYFAAQVFHQCRFKDNIGRVDMQMLTLGRIPRCTSRA